eukprot:970056-Amphidinium_carterae.1
MGKCHPYFLAWSQLWVCTVVATHGALPPSVEAAKRVYCCCVAFAGCNPSERHELESLAAVP